jgi:hypothetical protein
MQRTRPIATEALAPGPSLSELLEGIRGPGRVRANVDAFLQALGRPPSGEETPRARADLLLSLMEDGAVRDYTSSDGRTVRTAAVEGLLALGYPYALEVPPEALAQARAQSAREVRPQRVPSAGLVTVGLAVLTQAGFLVPLVANELKWWGLLRGGGLHLLGAAVLPPVLAVLGGWLGLRWPRRVGVGLMALVGLGYLVHLAHRQLSLAMGMEPSEAALHHVPGARVLVSGGLLLLSAVLLRRPWEKESP